MNNYLATFIVDTRHQKDSMESFIEHLKANMEAASAQVGEVKDLGQKDFARVTDKKFPAGHYVRIAFSASSQGPAAVQERFRLDKGVNRVFIEAV